MPGPGRWLLALVLFVGCSGSAAPVRAVPAEVEWPDAAIGPDFTASSADAGPAADSGLAP